MDEQSEITPLARLLCGYAGKDAARQRLVWAYDARLADIVRTTREPMIGQMRLTWWHEVLTDESDVKGRGDPLADAIRALLPPEGQGGLLRMIDGWEALLEQPIDDAALEVYALGRGGGLFQALANADGFDRAGALWALWDLSGHSADPALVRQALALAQTYIDPPSRVRMIAPLRIAAGLARADARHGRAAPGGMTPGLYARALRIGLIGR